MGKGVGVLFLLVAAVSGDDLDGEIKGGKAKKLVDKAFKLTREADPVFDVWRGSYETKTVEEREPLARKAEDLYDRACDMLGEALEIRYDPGVNHLLRLKARRIMMLNGWLLKLEVKRYRAKKQKEEEAKAREEASSPKEEEPAPEREPEPEPVEQEPEQPRVEFKRHAPPGVPVDANLPVQVLPDDSRFAAIVKKDTKAIRRRLKDYFTARKSSKLLIRHKLCQGKGNFRDGTVCLECRGTGYRINLFFFRKVYWNCYTPLLRDTAGALDSLKGFYNRARRDPSVFGGLVKSFKVEKVEHKGFWARAAVTYKTDAGERKLVAAMVPIGRNWYFYQPRTDRSLLPEPRK